MKVWLLLVALLPLAAVAPASAACAPDSGVVIYYGNGMFITPSRARVQALLMDRRLRPHLPAGTKVTFSYAYNNNEDSYTQMLQVVAQAVLGKTSLKLPSVPKVPTVPSVPSVPSWVPNAEKVTSAIQAIEKASNPDSYVKYPDLMAHVARYRTDLAAGKRVLLLAHSQGNFYANKAHEQLSSTAGFGIVSVGTPDNYTAGNGPYTTLTNDEIIKPIPNRRAPNTSNSAAFNKLVGGDGHSFTGHYLDGDVSGPKIVSQVNTTLASLGCPATP